MGGVDRDFLPPAIEEGVSPHFNIYEIPFPKKTLCQVELKLTDWFLSRRFIRFLKVINVFLLCDYYVPLEKGWLILNIFEFT